MKKKTVLLLLAVTLFILTGCMKKAMMRKYYVLEPVQHISETDSSVTPLPYRVECKDFRIAKAFNQTRIAQRSRSHELNYYFYHHWAVRPPSAVSDFIFYIIQQKSCFQKCRHGFLADADYYLTGQIHRLERLNENKKEYAHISGVIQFLNAETDMDVVSHAFDGRIDISKNNSMNQFASAISTILLRETEQFILKVRQQFETSAAVTK